MKRKTYKNAKELIESIDMNEYEEYTGLSPHEIKDLIETLVEYTDMVLIKGPNEASQSGVIVTKYKPNAYSIRLSEFDSEL